MNKKKYEIEYADIYGNTFLMSEKFSTIKECVAIIKKLRKEVSTTIAQILYTNHPGKFRLYRFSRQQRNYEQC